MPRKEPLDSSKRGLTPVTKSRRQGVPPHRLFQGLGERLFAKCSSCVWPAGLTELLPDLVLEGVKPVAACLDGTLVDADDEASRDHAVVGVEETDHVVVAATSRVEIVQVRSGRGEPDDEYDSRKGDANHDNVLFLSGGCYRRGRCPSPLCEG